MNCRAGPRHQLAIHPNPFCLLKSHSFVSLVILPKGIDRDRDGEVDPRRSFNRSFRRRKYPAPEYLRAPRKSVRHPEELPAFDSILFFLMIRRPPRSTLFPYTMP